MRWWERQIGGATRGKLIALLRRGTRNIEELAGKLRVTDNAVRAQMQALEKAKIATVESGIKMVPKNLMKLEGKNAQAMLRMSDALEDHDDVQNVYSNFDIDEDEVA